MYILVTYIYSYSVRIHTYSLQSRETRIKYAYQAPSLTYTPRRKGNQTAIFARQNYVLRPHSQRRPKTKSCPTSPRVGSDALETGLECTTGGAGAGPGHQAQSPRGGRRTRHATRETFDTTLRFWGGLLCHPEGKTVWLPARRPHTLWGGTSLI